MKIPKMRLAAEVCLVSALSLGTAEATAKVLPISDELRRRIHALIHDSRYNGPPSETTTLSSLSASGGTTALPPLAQFETNWTPRLFPPSYGAVYPPAMQPWHLGWLDDEVVKDTRQSTQQ